jgi:hypothetical protein
MIALGSSFLSLRERDTVGNAMRMLRVNRLAELRQTARQAAWAITRRSRPLSLTIGHL